MKLQKDDQGNIKTANGPFKWVDDLKHRPAEEQKDQLNDMLSKKSMRFLMKWWQTILIGVIMAIVGYLINHIIVPLLGLTPDQVNFITQWIYNLIVGLLTGGAVHIVANKKLKNVQNSIK